jgi:hypothetical protein
MLFVYDGSERGFERDFGEPWLFGVDGAEVLDCSARGVRGRSRGRCARRASVSSTITRVWAKDEPFGTEYTEVTVSATTLVASGVAIGCDPCPYRLDYELATADEFVTTRLVVRTAGQGWRRALVLERSAAGEWSCTAESAGDLDWPAPGGDLAVLAGALDCDLGLSPLTNTLPVLRHGLLAGSGPVDLLMAWVAVPELAVSASPQRYTFLRRDGARSILRFESLDDNFAADITFDQHGLVLDYPGIARVVA